MKKLILVLLLLLGGCISAPPVHDAPTLLVFNNRGDVIKVHLDTNYVGRAYPGANCFPLRWARDGQHHVLRFNPLATDVWYETDPMPFASREGWMMELTQNLRFDVFTLVPGPPCREGFKT